MRGIVIRNEGVRQLGPFWLDGARWPWRFVVAITVVILLNFAMFFAILRLAGNWGLLWTPVFLFMGYRTAKVIDAHAEGPAKPRI